jgi:type VI secretion system protein ImpE
MDPKEYLKAGRLLEARKLLIDQIKAAPADSGLRTLLFQVLSYLGEWDKARRHLDTLALQDARMETGVQTYRHLLTAEAEREKVVTLLQPPSLLPESPVYFESYYSGLEKLAEKDIEKAKELLDQARAMRPTIRGTLNGNHFEGFSDTDTFLSPFLEVFVHDRYAWIPFECIRELTISRPETFLDLLWSQADITTWEGLTMNCYLPILYPTSYKQKDERIQLGRLTDWIPLGGGLSKGVGQHVFEAGKDDVAILEIRELRFQCEDLEAKGETDG